MTKVDLSDSKYAAFYDKLANDSAFRESVKRDPRGALAAHGIDLDPAVVFKIRVKLPSKRELNDNLDAHIERLSALDARMSFIR